MLWLLLALIGVRGVASFVLPPPAAAPVSAAASTLAPDPQLDAARTFALLFSEEYLTWRSTDSSEHAARLRPYLRGGLDEQAGWSGTGARDQTVLGASVYADQRLSESKRLVSVAVRTRLTGGSGSPAAAERVVYLAVPISVSPQGLSVYDFPTYLPPPSHADPQGALYGDEVTDPDPQIRPLVEGFLRAYTGGSDAEVAYFMAPGAHLTGLRGALRWQALPDVKVYRTGGELLALAESTLLESASNAIVRQHYLLRLEKRERWYVKDLVQKGASN